eukprot:scaffold188181_cov38-Attheya_sp.AAC.1
MGSYEIHEFFIYNRIDCCRERLLGLQVEIFLNGLAVWNTSPTVIVGNPVVVINVSPSVRGDTVKLSIPGRPESLTLAEVQVEVAQIFKIVDEPLDGTDPFSEAGDMPDSFNGSISFDSVGFVYLIRPNNPIYYASDDDPDAFSLEITPTESV